LHGRTLLAIDLPEQTERLAPLWQLVRSDALAGVVLDEVVRAGLSTAPSFVLIGGYSESATTVFVRGTGVVRIVGPSGTREISGEGISSWVEQVIHASDGFEFRLGASSVSPSWLPLGSGVVRAKAVRSDTFVDNSVSAGPVTVPPQASPEVSTVAVSNLAKESDPVVVAPPPLDIEVTLAAQTTTIAPVEQGQAEREGRVATPEAVEGSSYDHLFGETVFRKVEDAAVRESDDAEPSLLVGPPPPTAEIDDGDHDGHTVMVSDIAALRAKRKAARAAAPPEPPSAPTLYLELSTGGRETLDQPLIIGRAPSATRVSGGNVPRLVSMNTPNQDISRTHAQITAEGGTVVVTDLHSSNGTTIILPGKPAQKLRPGEPSAVIVGTIIDLGDGATLTVCES
jgi:hypothetical protein